MDHSTKLPAAIRRFRYEFSATAAVEFAILSPLFLTLLLGIMAYGIYFGASHSLQQIAADAARTAVAGLDDTERRKLATDFISRNAGGYPFVDPKKLTVDVHGDVRDPNRFEVNLRYDARDLPIFNLFSTIPMPNTTIARNSTIRIGGI